MTCKRLGNGLLPIGEDSLELLRRIPFGKEVIVSVKTARNPKQFRLYWAICRIVSENSDHYETPEQVSEALKIGTGRYDRTILRVPGVGEVEQLKPHSIAIESMKQTDFEQYLDAALLLIETEMLPGINRHALLAEAGKD